MQRCYRCGVWEIYARLGEWWRVVWESTGIIMEVDESMRMVCYDEYGCIRRMAMRMK